MSFLRRLSDELGRLKTELFVVLVAGGAFWYLGFVVADLKELLFVALKYGLAITVLHATRSVLFFYVCLQQVVYGTGDWKDVDPVIRAAVALGIFLFYALGLSGILNAI